MKSMFDWMNEGYKTFATHMERQGVDMGAEFTMQNTLPLVCKDGFTLSVQASFGHYSQPRQNFATLERGGEKIILADYSMYNKFELGFPSESDDLILEYAEDPENPTETVYGFVPVEVVIALLDKHGGVVSLKNVFENR